MSLEKMDELFGITDDFLRVMDENHRERAASRMAAGETQVAGRGSLTKMATASGERQNESSRELPVYRV